MLVLRQTVSLILDISVHKQTKKVHTKNKKIQFNVNTTFGRRRGTNTVGTNTTSRVPAYNTIYSSSSSEEEKDDDDYVDLNNSFMSVDSNTIADENENFKIRKGTMNMIKEKPLTFLGLPPENVYVCESIAQSLKVDIIFIFACLVKI
uniref:Uncharacterized protein n=1 Tax=Cacopsylla melanoneura TaxID=428564 RepID=A0A8D8TSQ0_9HEMI